MMEELTKRNVKGVWLREIDKVLKRFDTSVEWLVERLSYEKKRIQSVTGKSDWRAGNE